MTYLVDTKIYRVLLTTGATESITVSGVYGVPTIDASGTGYVTYTTPGSPVAYPLMGWPVGGAPTKIADEAKDASIWGSQIAWSMHWSSVIYPSSTLRPAVGQPLVTLDAPPGGFVGPGGPVKASGRDYAVRNGWTAYTHVVGTQLQAWTRAPDGTTALASPYGNVLLAGMNDQGEVVVDNKNGDGSITRSLSKANGALPTVPVQLGVNRGRMQYIGGTWYEAVGCALFRVGAGSLDPGSGITPPTPLDAGADADADAGMDGGGTDDGGTLDDAGASVDSGGMDPDAGVGEDAGSSSGGAGGSSSSSGSGAGSPGTPPSGGDDGGCATGGSSPAGALSSTSYRIL